MKRSKFSLSHYKLLTCNQGDLVPCSLMEVLPGDSIQQSTSALIRLSPLLAPVMHPVHAKIHHWFVPMRLIWDDWEKFITGGPDGNDASVFPTININYTTAGVLADYLGVPPGAFNQTVSALPFRAYALIWNEFYRDQDLQTELVISKASGADTTTSTTLQQVAWEKDYFTTARPWPQKGDEITIPISGTAPVSLSSTTGVFQKIKLASTHGNAPNATPLFVSGGAGDMVLTGNGEVVLDPNGTLEADLDVAGAEVSINDLRDALALQRFQENRARFGSRYVEYLRYLGVKSSDARLQRPEYLGGGKQTIQFSEVVATSPGTFDEEDQPTGSLSGHGIGALRSNRYRRFFEEHGYVLTFISVKPKTMYTQGLHRTWLRRTKEDFFQKELQNLGQQEIMVGEIFAVNPDSAQRATWGYQDRYDEYRRMESSVAGEFRNTLDFWHMARIFGSQPTLNADFIKSNPTDRVYAITSSDQLQIMTNHSVQARRIVSGTAKPMTF